MGYLALFAIALKRSRNRWALTLLSLVGIAMTIGVIASIPLFIESVGFRILEKELEKQSIIGPEN